MEKKIKGFENYTINDSGDNEKMVYNTVKKKYKKPQRHKNGYLFVSLYQDGRNKIFLLHRLVAEAFIANPDNKPCVDHINTIRTDNRIENLKWSTVKENANNPLTKIHASDSRKGIKFSEETRKKMSEVKKGKLTGEKNPFYGKHHSDETKKKSSDRMKKNLNENPELKKKLEEYIKIALRKMFKPKYQIDPTNNTIVKIWDNYDEFAKSEYDANCVRKCCKGERKTYKGYIWKYI